MEGSALAPPRQVQTQTYLILTILLGIAGSLIAMAAFARGTYRIGPLVVEMKAFPSGSGTTELGVQLPATIPIKPGNAKADTHAGFLAFEARVVGVYGEGLIPAAAKAAANPKALADEIEAEGKSAARKFGLKVGLVVLGGGAAGGFAVALLGMRARRVFQGLIAGVIVVAILGVVAWQTYDVDKFSEVQFTSGSAIVQR